MRHFLTIICACLLLAACHEDEKEVTAPSRTVLVYVAGENTLSRFFSAELIDMIAGSQTMQKGDNLVLYVDIADNMRNPYLINISQGDTATFYRYPEDSYASDPSVMADVIHRAFSAYPADSYGLVLWGHASGWLISNDSISHSMMARRNAYGVDNGQNSSGTDTGKLMNIPTLAKVLQRSGYPLKFIFADCCNFMCAEVAYELRNTADYIIGSPAEIPGVGAPYTTVVPALFSRSEMFYKEIVDAYYEQTVGGHQVPLSVVKTSEMGNLASQTRTALKAVDAEVRASGSSYPDMSGLIYYYSRKYQPTANVMYDMNDFMLRYAGSSYQAWREALDRAVVYKTMATTWETNGMITFDFDVTDERYGGLSMFVPQPPSFYNYMTYNENIKKMAWYYAVGLGDFFK
ncbi:MAG: hypothetical protein IJP74_05635 [Prevotella sp.]|nr:hypothetical protein [Prevotella sp.]